MKYAKRLTASLLLLATSLTVSACGKPEPIRLAYPPAADLAVEPKPLITPDVLASDVAAAEYDSAVEAWGERGWKAIGRICNWAKRHGADIVCKPE